MAVTINDYTNHADVRTLLNAIKTRLQDMCMSKAGCAVSGASGADVKWANTVTYSIDGVLYSKATTTIDVSAQATPALSTQATDTQCNYLICVKADGTGIVVQGDESADADTAASWPAASAVPAGYVAIGGFVVKNETDSAYTPGTTTWDTTNLTETFYDFQCNPADLLS